MMIEFEHEITVCPGATLPTTRIGDDRVVRCQGVIKKERLTGSFRFAVTTNSQALSDKVGTRRSGV